MIDTHCHLDRYPNPKRVADRAKRAGITIIAVTNLPSHFRDGLMPASRLTNVRLSLGLHPLLAPHSHEEYRLFSELVSKTSYIGEIGLDFSPEGLPTRDAQINSFRFVLSEIRNSGKVLSIHSRKAEEFTLEILFENHIRSAIFHWFTGDQSTLARVIEGGHYLSVNPAMLRSERGSAVVKSIPRDRVLFETDGPYCKLTKGPWDVSSVAATISRIWNCSVHEARVQVDRNFRQMLHDRRSQ